LLRSTCKALNAVLTRVAGEKGADRSDTTPNHLIGTAARAGCDAGGIGQGNS